jgi:NADH-quinone oxidoreductase subunit A
LEPNLAPVVATETGAAQLSPEAANLFAELGVRSPYTEVPANAELIHTAARSLSLTTFADILVFFAVLLVGFAYVWKRGDLDWVRAMTKEKAAEPRQPPRTGLREEEPALIG